MVGKQIKTFDLSRFQQMACYNKLTKSAYDENIRVVPAYEMLHKCLVDEMTAYAKKATTRYEFKGIDPKTGRYCEGSRGAASTLGTVELGVGTGHSSDLLLDAIPQMKLTGIEVLDNMVEASKERLIEKHGEKRVSILQGDYFAMLERSALRREWKTLCGSSIVFSVISVHHVADEMKRWLIRDAYNILQNGGIFVLADLMLPSDPKKQKEVMEAAEANLIKNATTPEIRDEWLRHWRELNILGTVENHLKWFVEAGFSNVRHVFSELTTNMIVGVKEPCLGEY